ncbi:MAG: hypothetical protein AAF602_03525 [Myxococcota bacterium]
MGSTRAGMPGPDDDSVPLRVGLRQWVLGLERSELIVVHGWIQRQLVEVAKRPSHPFVLVPDEDDALEIGGENFLTIASRVRLHICRLPRTHLIVLEAWLTNRMREHGA